MSICPGRRVPREGSNTTMACTRVLPAMNQKVLSNDPQLVDFLDEVNEACRVIGLT